MAHMKDYPLEFTKPLELSFKILDHCNIKFFNEDIAPLKKYWWYLVMIPSVILHYASLTMFMVNIFIESKEILDLAVTVPIHMVASQAIFKYVIIMLNRKKIRYIITQLGSTWRVDNLTAVQREKKNAVLKRLEFCQKAYYYTSIIGSWLYSLSPPAEALVRKFILQQERELVLPYPCKYPFDPTQSWTVYALVYMFQVYAMFHLIFAYLGAEFLILTLCSHLVTEFTLLREDLLHTKPVLNQTGQDVDELGEFVKKHQKLTWLCQQTDKIFNKITFVILLFATIIVCFFAFAGKLAHGSPLMLVNYIAVPGMLGPVFILCYYSELLAIESAGIADSAYSSPWYEGGTHHKKSISFIILRSQLPCCLTSLKYSPITLNTFSKVLSTTWSYFSLMTRVYEKEIEM